MGVGAAIVEQVLQRNIEKMRLINEKVRDNRISKLNETPRAPPPPLENSTGTEGAGAAANRNDNLLTEGEPIEKTTDNGVAGAGGAGAGGVSSTPASGAPGSAIKPMPINLGDVRLTSGGEGYAAGGVTQQNQMHSPRGVGGGNNMESF